MEDQETYIVFVYGTLKKGFGNHRLLQDSEFIKEESFTGKFELISDGMLPYLVKRDFTTTVHGELYKVNKETLKRLDRLEGHPDFYKRGLIAPNIITYYYQGNSHYPSISTGRYTDRFKD